MRLEHHLVLARWLHGRLGSGGIDDLKADLQAPEPGVEGETPYLRALLEREGVRIAEDRLRDYDSRIRSYETRLAEARGAFSWKYFQYLALLHSEIFLDALTSDPIRLLAALNEHVAELRGAEPHLGDFPDFEPDDLRRIALFMATGSGKTLLLHANLWQVVHYLEHGRHPEALVRRADGRREFDNLILVTPAEGLSEQHLDEFRRSGIEASHLAHEASPPSLFGPQVRVIEISKLADEVSGGGLSVALESLGSSNLVFVDEGHKGVGSEAREWKRRQRALSADGFLIEYSATFAQSVAAAPTRARRDLLAEYGKTIVFDYSYRQFYADGYGKHFEVLNLESDQTDRAHELLVGGLLTFYQQVHLFETRRDAFHPFGIERPLWVFLGAGVVKTGKRDLSDVATVVDFLRRFLGDPDWAIRNIGRVLSADSGFSDPEGQDLFAAKVDTLRESDPEVLYAEIVQRVFHGRGELEVWELKRGEGELGLRTSGADDAGPRYFGVVNVGDAGAFRRHLEREADFDVKADEFTESLFPRIDIDDSPVNVLIGSRKFIEGWSSWRVSTMGLLNMGRGEGPQVIQLFGRGVRLKGRDWTLQRSTGRGLPEEGVPAGLAHLETLQIFGWNADYVQAFRDMLSAEEVVSWELEVPVRTLFDPEPVLYVPRPEVDTAERESWTLEAAPITVRIDMTPRVTAMAADAVVRAESGPTRLLDFTDDDVVGLLDVDRLYVEVLEHKSRRGYDNLLVRPGAIRSILPSCDVYLPEEEAEDPGRVQEGAYRAIAQYMERLVALRERQAQARTMGPVQLEVEEKATRPYRVSGSDPDLRERLVELVSDRERLFSEGGEPLPRLHVDRHLYSPLLVDPRSVGLDLSVIPSGLKESETSFVQDLVRYWDSHHDDPDCSSVELYLLRNLPHSGVGFFQRSGFYPDFMLWVKRGEDTLLQFVEPHGMHHGGLVGNKDKIEAFRELARLSEENPFVNHQLRMSGFILTQTDRQQIPGAENRDWTELRERFRLLSSQTDYLPFLLAP